LAYDGEEMEQIARTAQQMGQALQRRRRSLGLTQAQLGRRAKLRQATVSAIEAGEPRTQLRTLIALLAALDLELVVRRRSASSDDLEALFP
jgi:HTH-type transcriptional regulator/antitoxin HipB